MSVHYKFKSALDYDTVTFDGLHISVGDLKAAISQQKRIGKTSDFDLQITNAQTKEVYVDDNSLIPKNTSLLVARVPLSQQPKKQWEGSSGNSSGVHKDVAPKGLADLSRMEGSEQDKINAMITQSTFDYDPSNYQKIRGQNQRGVVPPNYICYKCQKRGHWIKDCPVANSGDPIEIRRSTGIPRSFMVPVEGPKAPGAMMTPSGTFAVPAVDHEAYLASENAGGADTPTNAPAAPEPNIPDELICSLCRDLLTDAVMIPCCGNSFCDECIRGALLESEDHECPDCREKEIAPTTLIPNRFLRNSVSSFRNQTGYSRRTPHRPAAPPVQQLPPIMEPPPAVPVQQPPNGPGQPGIPSDSSAVGGGGRGPVAYESDGSADDNITVTVPPPAAAPAPRAAPPHAAPNSAPHAAPRAAPHAPHRPPPRHANMHRPPRYGPPPLKPVLEQPPPNINIPHRLDEQRASTPTIDERRDPMSNQGYNRPPPYVPGVPPPSRRYSNRPYDRHGHGASGAPPPFDDRYPPLEPYQPPPPGIKDSPNGHNEDPLEAFNRMIREKEMRAKRREERRRAASGSRSPRSRSRSAPRSPRSPRSPPPRSPRSPPPPRSPRSPLLREPRVRVRSRGSSRIRYSRSRSISRGRIRRSPWSPRRRRTRERTLSLTRSPSPRRRHRSPLRYRSPLRSPLRSPPRSPLRSPTRSLPREPLRTPPREMRRSAMRSPPPMRPVSPHRYAGVYDELLSPPRRSLEPPYGSRYGPRNNVPPPGYPPFGAKPVPLMGISIPNEPPAGYRGRYEGPPFEDVPPGVEPPVPGFEPSPFEKPPFGPGGPLERDRIPPSNYREPYRPPYVEGPPGFRDLPITNVQSEIPVHVGEQPRYRDNFRPGHSFRDQAPPYRDGQPYRDVGPQGPYRDNNFRGVPPSFRDSSYRNAPYRDGAFRENPPHGFRESGAPNRPPSADPRDPVPPNANFLDPNFRDGFREENNVNRGDPMRPGYRSNTRNRAGSRRNPLEPQDRHRDREGRDRERYHESRDPSERSDRIKAREGRDGREERPRDYDRNRDYEKEREREHERSTPDKKSRISPKKNRETRDKKRSESRGRSRDRESRREKKDERGVRDKSSADRSKDHKDKEKKIKERKKKKREKEKDTEKKKKRDKKEKKEKESTGKKEEGNSEKSDVQADINETGEGDAPVLDKSDDSKVESENTVVNIKKESTPQLESETKITNDLYGDEASEAIDKEIIEKYGKAEENDLTQENKIDDNMNKEEPFDGIELQASAEELDLKGSDLDSSGQSKEMLAPLPELSKWEVDEEHAEKLREPGEISSPEAEEGGKVTSDVIKRAENAIFAKAINSLRPIEIKKISSDRLKLYGDEPAKSSIQITVPVTDSEQRQIEINEKKRRSSKTPPPRLSVKDRLGGKVEDIRRPRETRVVHSTVERVKSRSKTPKKEQQYRRVTVDRDRTRKNEGLGKYDSKSEKRMGNESVKTTEKHRARSPHETSKKKDHKGSKEEKTFISNGPLENKGKSGYTESKKDTDRERKKSVLDEAHFEPDYDETLESDNEHKEETAKKRSASPTNHEHADAKKAKIESETIKLDLTNVKKKRESDSESSSDSEYSSSSSSSDARKSKKKKKRSKKKKKKRAASDSESETDSSSDDHKKKKKKRKHKKKSSKKKKKSKHK